MILLGITAFISSYFSVFHTPRLDLFWPFYSLLALFLFYFKAMGMRLLAVFVFFFLWTQAALQWQFEHQYNVPEKATVTAVFKVLTIPKTSDYVTSFMVRPLSVLDSQSDFDFMRLRKIKLSWYRPSQLVKAGQIWQMTVKIQPPHGLKNQGGFDYERWMFANHISATGYVLSSKSPTFLNKLSNDPVLITRGWIHNKIADYTQGLEHAGVFSALSIGYKDGLDPKLKQLLVETGTAHLLVISGLHVGLLSAFFYFLSMLIWRWLSYFDGFSVNQKDFSIVIAWVAALIYTALAGFTVPTVRAMLMLSVFYLALLRRQPISLLDSLALALMLVLLCFPLSLLSFSFWLSFLAILVIAVSQFSALRGWRAVIFLQLMFALLFIPLNAIVFGQFVLSGFLANLVMIPVVGFVLIPLNLLATVFSSLDMTSVVYIYAALNSLLSYLIDYLQYLNHLFSGVIKLPDLSPWLMLVSVFGMILLLFFYRLKIKLAATVLLFVPWLYAQNPIAKGSFKATFYDIGMGTAVLVETARHVLLYDLGPGNARLYQPAKWVILPHLQAKGIDYLDRVVVSHSDQDHYGGYWGLAESGLIEHKIIDTSSVERLQAVLPQSVLLRSCHQQEPWVWDGVRFEFLAIKQGFIRSDNNQSCVLAVSTGKRQLLLTGDIEKQRELELLTHYAEQLRSDVILVPHHGSNTSSSAPFLAQVDADYAVVTSGYLNRWGFPRQRVIAGYEQLATKWFDTATMGAITFDISDQEIAVSVFREQGNALWY